MQTIKKEKPFIFLDDIAPMECEQSWQYPEIFDLSNDRLSIPSGFNSVSIHLDGRANASLDWDKAHQLARHYISQGFRLFWDLDLGLFQGLCEPLSDQTQYLTLGLSLKHFRDTLWKEFREHTIGLSLYRGSTTLHGKQFDWEEAVDYIHHLAGQLPGELPVCVCFDTQEACDPFRFAQLISKERFDRLHRCITEHLLPAQAFTKQPAGYLSEHKQELHAAPSLLGICLPMHAKCLPEYAQTLQNVVRQLMDDSKPFRFVCEAALTTEWDGLEMLLVVPQTVTSQGIRKLRGFCAAGGTVLTLGPVGDLAMLSNVRKWN